SSTTKTDADGKYSFDNVPSGLTYTVTPSKEGTTFRASNGNNFTLHGNRTDIDFTADQLPFTVSGTVTDADDKPLKDIEVVISSKSGTTQFKPRTEKTDKDGKYTFTDVPGGPGGAVYTVTPKPRSTDKV